MFQPQTFHQAGSPALLFTIFRLVRWVAGYPSYFHTTSHVQDLKIKCEIYVEFLPEQVFEFFLQQCQHLKIVQYIGPVDWIVHEDILDVFNNNSLEELEVFVLSNTSTELMNLGLPTVFLFLEKCKNLIALGDLKTWKKIDFYDPESEHFFKSESLFSTLKKNATKKNWEIDFDLENVDFMYLNK